VAGTLATLAARALPAQLLISGGLVVA